MKPTGTVRLIPHRVPRHGRYRSPFSSRPPLAEAQKLTAKLIRIANNAACHIEQVCRLRRALKSRERQLRILRREPGARAMLEAEILQIARVLELRRSSRSSTR
jgi:hypothetical protein